MMPRPLATALIAVGLAVTFACSEDDAKPRTRNTQAPEKAQTSAVTPAPGPAGAPGPASAPAPGPGALSDEGGAGPSPGPAPGPGPGPASPAAPKITFVQPKTAQANVHEVFNVELSFANVAPDAKWSLYRTPTQGAVTGGTALVSARPVSNGIAAVDTTALPNGTFYIHARLDGSPTVATAFPFPITVAHPGAPVVQLVKPTAGGVKMLTVDVEVAFQNVPAGSTWSLFAATTAGAIDGGAALETALPVATTSKTVTIGGLATNVYYLYAKVDGTAAVVTSPHALSVGNRAPVVTALTVGTFSAATISQQKRAFAPGEVVALDFEAEDPDGDTVTYTVEYTTDRNAGTPVWTEDASGITASDYDFTIPAGAPDGLAYGVRVIAKDAGLSSAPRASTAAFGVRSAAPTWTADIGPILTVKCVPCHSTATAQSGRIFDTYVEAQLGLSGLHGRALVADNMPPAGAPNGDLTAGEKDLIQYWLWFQAPN